MVRIAPVYHADGLTPDKDGLLEAFSTVEQLVDFHDAVAISTPGYGGTAEVLFRMTLGNHIGVRLDDAISVDDLFVPAYGSFIVELADDAKIPATSNLVEISEIGETTEDYTFHAAGEDFALAPLQETWESALEDVFPTATPNTRPTNSWRPWSSTPAGAHRTPGRRSPSRAW